MVRFNVYWAALPSGRLDSLLAGCMCNCTVLEAWKRQQCTVAEALNHGQGRAKVQMGARKNEWAQKCNGGMASRFTRMYRVYLGMGM